jgi:hypothetical protein
MKRLIGMMCTLAALRAGGDTLADVRAAVGRLSAKPPLRATFQCKSFSTASGRFGNDKTQRNVSVEVAHDAAGISITVPQTLLDEVSRARNRGDTSAQNLIGSIGTVAITDALDFRDSFLAMLDHAVVTREERIPFQGKPARHLLLKLQPRPKQSGTIDIGTVKTDVALSLWIGEDSLPLAAEHTQKGTAGFMFFHATYAGRASYTFAHTANRLMVVRLEMSGNGAGLGQNVETTNLQTLTLH